MLLVIDIGNSNTVIGLYKGEDLLCHWRVVTRHEQTADEYYILLKELLQSRALPADCFQGIAVSCVVPPLHQVMADLCRRYFQVQPLLVGPGIKTGMPIHVDNPREVGADRIANAVAAYERAKSAVIVIDFGTATTLDFITSRGSFEGGIIAPGLLVSTEALFKQASKLPRVEMIKPSRVIGKSTVAAMQSGIINGYAGMVDSLVESVSQEVKRDWPDEPEPLVMATGGPAALIAPQCRLIKTVDDNLTIEGLRIIFQRNLK